LSYFWIIIFLEEVRHAGDHWHNQHIHVVFGVDALGGDGLLMGFPFTLGVAILAANR
jgi:hypothetical protein